MTMIKTAGKLLRAADSTVTKFDTQFQTFERLRVSRSIDGVCGEFSIVFSRPKNNEAIFKVEQVLDIKLDGQQVMRGKIYDISLEGDAFNDYIIVSGRDITGDLIDSTVPDSSKVFVAGANIFDIAGKIISAKGMSKRLTVVNGSGAAIAPFTKDEIVSCETGDTVIGFLHKYCRKRQLFLNTTTEGNLLFFKASGTTTGNRIINQFVNNNNNVISYKSKFNAAERFYKYICKSQDSNSWTSGSSSVDTQGIAIDTGVGTFREKEFKLEEGSSGSDECAKRAAEEANVRRARAFEYIAEVQGFKDKKQWTINQLVSVADDRAGVSGEFLIRAVDFIVDNRKGSTTKLTITNKDAYTAQASINLRAKQETKQSWYNQETISDALRLIQEGAE